jgi:hypothetical protein
MIDLQKGQIHKIIPEIDDALQKQQVPLFSRGGKVVMPITKPKTASRGRTTYVTSFAEWVRYRWSLKWLTRPIFSLGS